MSRLGYVHIFQRPQSTQQPLLWAMHSKLRVKEKPGALLKRPVPPSIMGFGQLVTGQHGYWPHEYRVVRRRECVKRKHVPGRDQEAKETLQGDSRGS